MIFSRGHLHLHNEDDVCASRPSVYYTCLCYNAFLESVRVMHCITAFSISNTRDTAFITKGLRAGEGVMDVPMTYYFINFHSYIYIEMSIID